MGYERSLRNNDYIRKLADYIKRNSEKGYKIEALKWALTKQGHSRTCVERALEVATKEIIAAAPKLEIKEERKVEIYEGPKHVKKGFFARLFGR